MTGYVADLSWKSGAREIEKLDRLRSTMAVNVLRLSSGKNIWYLFHEYSYFHVPPLLLFVENACRRLI